MADSKSESQAVEITKDVSETNQGAVSSGEGQIEYLPEEGFSPLPAKEGENFAVMEVSEGNFQDVIVTTEGLTMSSTDGVTTYTIANSLPTQIMENDDGQAPTTEAPVQVEEVSPASKTAEVETSVKVLELPSEVAVTEEPSKTTTEGEVGQAMEEGTVVQEGEADTKEDQAADTSRDEIVEVPSNITGLQIVEVDGQQTIIQVEQTENDDTGDVQVEGGDVQAAQALAQIAYQMSHGNQIATTEQNVAEVMSNMSGNQQMTIQVIQTIDEHGNEQMHVQSIEAIPGGEEQTVTEDTIAPQDNSDNEKDEDWEPEQSAKKKKKVTKSKRQTPKRKQVYVMDSKGDSKDSGAAGTTDISETESGQPAQFIVEIVRDEDLAAFTVPSKRPKRESSTPGKLTPLSKRLGQRPDVDMSKLTCLNCNTSYSSSKTLAFHMQSLHSESRTFYPCMFCTSVFAQLWGVTRHIVQSHNKTKEEVFELKEILRSKAFSRSSDEIGDIQFPIPDASPGKQQILPKREASKNKRVSVIKFSGGFSLHKCSGCGKAFAKLDALNAHSDICSGKADKADKRRSRGKATDDNDEEEKAEEVDANKSADSDVYNFLEEPSNKSRADTSTENAPDTPSKIKVDADTGRYNDDDMKRIEGIIDQNSLVCTKCRRSYGTISNLRRHAVRHLGWRRFKCTLCKFTAFNRSECNSHLRRIHAPKAAMPLGDFAQYILDLEEEEVEAELPLGPQRRTMVTESEFRLSGREVPVAPAGKPKTPGSKTPSGKLVGETRRSKRSRRSKGNEKEKDLESLTLDDVANIEKNIKDEDEDEDDDEEGEEIEPDNPGFITIQEPGANVVHVVMVEDEAQDGEKKKSKGKGKAKKAPPKVKAKSPKKRPRMLRKDGTIPDEEDGEEKMADDEVEEEEDREKKTEAIAGELLELFSDPTEEDDTVE